MHQHHPKRVDVKARRRELEERMRHTGVDGWSKFLLSAMLCAVILPVAEAQTAVTIVPPNLSGPVAGTVKGSASVDPTGAARYSVSIPLPPGTAGLQPTLSLEYSSQAGTGLFGKGWSLNGMSAITRCGSNIATDTVRLAVSLTAADQFCLDGQRLMKVSGTQGAVAEYRTQIDTFSQVKSVGSNTAKGPDSWTVATKSGLIFTYGGTADSTLIAQGTTTVLTWALSRVQDQRSNYYDVSYTQIAANTELYPRQIRYTGHVLPPVQATYNAINFVAESRSDSWLGYLAGSVLKRTQRIKNIQTYINTDANGNGGTLVRDYRLAYTNTNSDSARSLISSITDCDTSGNCLPATSFAYNTLNASQATFAAAGSGNWGGPSITFENTITYGPQQDQIKAGVLLGDFNGDGKTDLLYASGGSAWQLCLSTGTSFSCSSITMPSVHSREILLGDFNGDGKTDVAIPPSTQGTGQTWQLCLSTGSGFTCSNWTGPSAGRFPNYYLVADFDGDGLDDIAVYSSLATTYDYLCKSTGTTFPTGCVTYGGVATVLSNDVELKQRNFRNVGDVNGDGKADVLLFISDLANPATSPGTWRVYTATPTGFVSTSTVAAAGPGSSSTFYSQPGANRFLDHTGDPYDSYADMLVGFANAAPYNIQRCASTGTALSCTTTTVPTPTLVSSVADYDGDGKLDALTTGSNVCQISDQGVLYGCRTWTAATLPAGTVSAVLTADFNGDGIPDTATYSTTTNSWTVNLGGYSGYLDALAQVTDGIGEVTQFTYKNFGDSSVYANGGTTTFPQRNLQQGSPLVSEMRTSNTVGGWLATDYKYEALRADVQGRGLLGFGKTTSIDLTTGISKVTTFSQTFPYIGLPTTMVATQTNGTNLSSIANILTSFSTSGGATYRYVSSSTVTSRELTDTTNTGTPISVVTSQVNGPGGIDAYGNILNSTDQVSAGGDTFTTGIVSTYDNITASWLIGLKRTSAVTKTVAYGDTGILPATLKLNGCVTTSPTVSPTPSTVVCTLANVGQTSATSVSYSSPTGTTNAGPSTCAAGTANCGTVTVSTTAAGTYTGTLTATPNAGTAATTPVSLTVTGSVQPFTFVSNSQQVQTNNIIVTVTFQNNASAAIPITAVSFASTGITGDVSVGPSSTCVSGNSLAAGATCTVILNTTRECTNYTASGKLSNSGGTTTGSPSTITKKTGAC